MKINEDGKRRDNNMTDDAINFFFLFLRSFELYFGTEKDVRESPSPIQGKKGGIAVQNF